MEEKKNEYFEKGISAELAHTGDEALKGVPSMAVKGMAGVQMYFACRGIPVSREEAEARYGTEEEFFDAAVNAAGSNRSLFVVPLSAGLGIPEEDSNAGPFIAAGAERKDGIAAIIGERGSAGTVLLPGGLNSIAKATGGSFFLLPSSSNEMVIVTERYLEHAIGKDPAAQAEAMEQLQNSTLAENIESGNLGKNRIISEHAFHYDADRKVLESAMDFAQAKKLEKSVSVPGAEVKTAKSKRSTHGER